MARFTHPVISMEGSTEDGSWNLIGGTKDANGVHQAGDQPQFDGDPLFTGHYTLIGNQCHFSIGVDMDNITDFGTGQYYMSLPFQSEDNLLLNNGCLHDTSGGDQYAMMGHVVAGSDQLMLFSVSSNGRHVPFEDGTPVNLNAADNFHIAGTYHFMPR